MKRIEDTICEAIELIVNKAVDNASYDKTVQGIIKSCVDEATGKYLVQYQDSTFYAYSSNLDYIYSNGVSVYVLVPGNDMSDNKTIIGTVDNLGIDYINQASKEDLFNKIGASCINNSEGTFDLSSYREHNSPTEGTKTRYIEVLYDADAEHPENNRLDINEEFADLYLVDASSILCSGFFKTNFDLYQKNQGNYGIIFGIDFYDNASEEGEIANPSIVTRYYFIDVDNMEGNPYELTSGKRQYNIFDIDGENFYRISSISVFTEGFPNHKSDIEIEEQELYDISISDIELYAVEQMSEEEIASCGVSILTPQGTFFGANSANTSLTLKAQVKVKGKLINSDNLSFYWFKENLAVNASNYKYNQYGGRGWECLNPYNVIVEGDDEVSRQIEWVPAKDTYEVNLSLVNATKTNFKCVVIYNDVAYNKTVTIENRKSGVPTITIESDSGTQFYYNVGRPNLTCKINGIEDVSYTYVWAKQDAYGNVTILPEDSTKNNTDYLNYSNAVNNLETLNADIAAGRAHKNASAATIASLENTINSYKYTQMVHQNKLLKVAINEITNFAIFKCSVYNGNTYLGTASITLSNSLQTERNYSLVINEGNQTYQYNEYGVSPASKSLEKYITIPALTFTVYDSNGKPLSEEALRECGVAWKVPSSRSMLVSINAGDAQTETDEEGYTYYYDVNSISYKIRDKFYYDYKNNDIELFVDYKDQELVAKTNLTFIKQGDDGTNGTSYSCKIVPNTVDYFESYPTFTTSSNGIRNISGTFNFNNFVLTDEPSDTAPFIVKLYKSGEEIFSGSASGTTNKTNTGEEIEVLVEWGMLANTYDATNYDLSDFDINSADGYMKFTNIANNAGRIGANSIKCTVNFTDIDGRLNVLYATLPINVVRLSDTDYRIALNDNTGFRYAVYSSDGTNPKYDDTKPFELTVYETIEGIEEEISDLTNSNLYYVWGVEGDYYDFYTTNGTYIDSKDLIYQNFRINSNQGRVKPAPSYNGLCVNNRVYCEVHTDSTSGTLIGRIDIPVNLFLNRYGFAHLNAWDGNSIQINEEGGFILAPQMGAGKKDEHNSFTGVLMGEVRDPNKENAEVGLFGYSRGERSFFLDAETGDAYFRGTISNGNKNSLESTGSGVFFDKDGDFSIGDDSQYIKWIDDELNIQAKSFMISISDSESKDIQEIASEADAASAQATAAAAAALDVQTRANNGEFDGADGTDGRGISSIEVRYAEGTDGNTAPQSGWQSTVPTITEGNYLWTRVTTNYTSGNPSISYSVSRQGVDGTGVTISSTEIKYAVSTNGTQPPSSFPYSSPQTTSTGQYLWTRTVVNYSDGNSTTAYSCAAHGATGPKGDKGDTGVSITSVTNYYLASNLNSGVTKNTSGWKTDVSQVTLNETNCYLWNYEVTAGDNNQEISSTNPVIIGHYAKDGQSGADAIACVLSNESHTFAGTESAAVGETITITIYAYKGTTSLTPTAVTWSNAPNGMNITLSNDKKTITIVVTSSFSTANGVVPFSITLDGKTIIKNFSYAIAFKGTGGSAGADAKIITLTGATQVIKVDKAGNKTPSSSFTVTGTVTNTTISSWTYSVNGGSFGSSLPEGVSRNGNTVTIDPNTVGFNTLSIKASDGNKASDIFSIVRVVDGDDGSNGRGISQITEYYAVNNSSSTAPTGNDWKTTVQTTSNSNKYLWNYEVVTYTDGDSDETDPRIIGTYGNAGVNTATVYLYQRATSTPSKPSGNLTYTFSSASITSGTLGNWKQSIGELTGTNPIWVIAAVASSNGTTDVIASSDWSTQIKLAENGTNGTDGLNQATVFIYKRAASASKPASTSYTFSSGDFTVPTGWSKTIPASDASGNPCYVTSAVAIGNGSVATLNWVTPSVLVEDGKDGVSPTVTSTENGVQIYDPVNDRIYNVTNGTNGISYYTHILYSSKATPTSSSDVSTSPTGKSYVGIQTTVNQTAPSWNDSNWSWMKYIGDNGNSITISSIKYAKSTTDSQPSDSSFGTSIPTVGEGEWLWTMTTYSDNSKVYTKSKQGKSGTSVTVTKVEYQSGSSPTTAPTGTWSTSVPSVAEGNYLWTKTTYSDGNYSYTVAKQGQSGAPGTSVTISSTSVKYQVGTSATTAPTGTWQDTPQATAVNQFLWTRTIVNYSDNTSTTSYSVSAHGATGTSVGISSIKYAVNSTDSQPADSSFTYTSVPTVNEGQWLWTMTTYTNDSKMYTKSKQGKSGTNGISVTGVRELYYLKTNSTNPSQITSSSQITSTDRVNGWTSIVPSYVNNGVYYTCTETTLSSGGPVWSAPSENKGLTNANQKALDAYNTSMARDTEINALQAQAKYFWWNSEGAHIASGPESGNFDQDTISTYGYNALMAPGYMALRYQDKNFAQLATNSLTFFRPATNGSTYVQGKKAMDLTADALTFYKPLAYNSSNNPTAAAVLNSTGLNIAEGTIQLGTSDSSSTSSGNVTLSNVDFDRSINGTPRTDLRLAIGQNFGVKNDGTLYASNAEISGKITVGSGSNVYTKDETDGAISDVEIGGRNLLGGTANPTSPTLKNSSASCTFGTIGAYNTTASNISIEAYDDSSNALTATETATGNRGAGWYTKPGILAYGDTVTFSCRVKASISTTVHTHTAWRNGSATAAYAGWTSAGNKTIEADTWTDYSYTFDCASAYPDGEFMVALCFTGNASGLTWKVAHAKLERGSKKTDWDIAPEEIYNNIKIGGRNLVSNLSSNWSSGSWSIPAEEGEQTAITTYAKRISLINRIAITPNTDYWVRVYTTKSNVNLLFRVCDSNGNFLRSETGLSNQKWTSQANDRYIHLTLYENSLLSDIGVNTKVKIEQGNMATDWTPSPEDVDASAVARTQRIYYRSSAVSSGVPIKPNGSGLPTTWVTEEGDKWNSNATTASGWSRKVTPISNGTGENVTKYLYLWTATQKQMVDGTVAALTASDIALDGSTTVINGGDIITGTVTANQLNAASINASASLTVGALDSAANTAINKGVSALSKVEYYNRFCTVMNTSNTQTNYWRKFASYSETAANNDPYIIFDVMATGDFISSKKFGRLKAHLRTGSTKGSVTAAQTNLDWINRAEGIDLNDFVLAYKATSGTKVDIELWARCSTSWLGYVFNMVSEGSRTEVSATPKWTLYDSKTADGEADITSGFTRITSTDIDSARTTATSYITRINDQGIYISPSGVTPTVLSAPGNSVKIDGTGMEIYKNGTSVAFYGDSARIGTTSGSAFLINSDSLEAYYIDENNNRSRYLYVTPEGMMYGTDIVVASTEDIKTLDGYWDVDVISATISAATVDENELDNTVFVNANTFINRVTTTDSDGNTIVDESLKTFNYNGSAWSPILQDYGITLNSELTLRSGDKFVLQAVFTEGLGRKFEDMVDGLDEELSTRIASNQGEIGKLSNNLEGSVSNLTRNVENINGELTELNNNVNNLTSDYEILKKGIVVDTATPKLSVYTVQEAGSGSSEYTTVTSSHVDITSSAVNVVVDNNAVASMYGDTNEDGIAGAMRADHMITKYVYFRSDGTNNNRTGNLALVGRTNGHLSLKLI